MKHISRIEFQKEVIAIRYADDQDPKWVDEKILVVDGKKNCKVDRLIHVGYHIFCLLLENPKAVEANEESLLQWVGRLFDEQPQDPHEAPEI